MMYGWLVHGQPDASTQRGGTARPVRLRPTTNRMMIEKALSHVGSMGSACITDHHAM
jgi:hypothetical protein